MTWTQPKTKMFGVPLQKQMEKGADGTLLVRGLFTSDNRDEVGDIITRSATERAIPKYRQWGNIRRMHLPEPVAVVTRIGTEDGLAWNEVEIRVIDPQAVFQVENGLLKALSVGIFFGYDDVDFLEDGGFIINDYTLAEISLVDHPANYDAVLQRGNAADGIRTLVRTYGMDTVAQSFQTILEKELDGVDENTQLPADEIEQEVAPVEEPAEAPAPVEEPEQVDEVAPAPVSPEQPEEDETKVLLRSLIATVDALRSEVSALRVTPVAPAEVQPVQPVGGEDAQKDIDPEPANRVGGLPATEAVTTDVPASEPVRYASLREALTKYFQR